MSPSEFLGRADREPKIPSQNLDLRNPQGCERESEGLPLDVSDDRPTVDENPYVAFVAGKSRAEIKACVRSTPAPNPKLPGA